MLYAIEKSKASRNLSDEEPNWRELFKTSEDSLTSFIFERLFYLPTNMFWEIICNSCYGETLPTETGRILSKEFWPHWNSDSTDNANFVEPDVFIRFHEFDLIIEAKRWDDKQQSQEQWNNEVIAYHNEYGNENRKLYLIALGGLHNTDVGEAEGTNVVMCRWSRILQKIMTTLKNLSKSSDEIENNDSVIAILEDLIIAFQIHGFFTGEWLETIPKSKYSIKKPINTLAKNRYSFNFGSWFETIPNSYSIKIDINSLKPNTI